MSDQRHIYYPPNPNYGYAPPTTTRRLKWLMHAVGWIILVPTVLTTIACVLAVLFGIVCLLVNWWSIMDLIGWLILLGISGGMMTLGMVMTEKLRFGRD